MHMRKPLDASGVSADTPSSTPGPRHSSRRYGWDSPHRSTTTGSVDAVPVGGAVEPAHAEPGRLDMPITPAARRKSLLDSVARKRRTLHKFQVSTNTTAAFLAIREDAQFRAKVFGVQSTATPAADVRGSSGPWYIIMPDDRLKVFWDILFSFCVLWVTCRAPLLVAFGFDTSPILFAIDRVAEVVYIVDVVMQFFIAYTDDGDVVTNHAAIAWHYLTTWCMFDVIISIPYPILFPNTAWPLVQPLRMLHIERLLVLEQRAIRWLEPSAKHMGAFRLAKLFFYVMLAGHVSGCVWYFMAVYGGTSWNAWTIVNEVHHLSLSEKYMVALYWAFTTLTTVGYGDIVPHTTQERVFAMFLILAGAVTFGAIVGKISSLSASMNKREVAAQEQLTALDEFLKFYSLPRNLRHHTRRYHQLLSRLYPFRRENLLEDMSPFMRRAVQMHLYKDLLHSQPVLKFAAVFGEIAENMYFISTGTIEQINRWGFRCGTMETGSFFGESQVLDCSPSQFSYKAITNCELFSLSVTDLRRLLRRFPGFESDLRKVASLRSHSQQQVANSKKVQPPFGLRTWQEVSEARGFDKFYKSVLARSRTLQAASYNPSPLSLDIQEFITRNAHELWCAERIVEGWKYAPASNHSELQSSSLQPFDALSTANQDRLRNASVMLVKLFINAGYRIAVDNDEAVLDWEFAPAGVFPFAPNPSRLGEHLSVSDDLQAVARQAAVQDHECWARKLKDDGWSWAPRSSDRIKKHSRLLPFKFLPEFEQNRLHSRALGKVRDIIAAGFSIRSRQTGAKRDGDTDAASSGAAGAAPGSSLQKLEERLTHLERAMLRMSRSIEDVRAAVCPPRINRTLSSLMSPAHRRGNMEIGASLRLGSQVQPPTAVVPSFMRSQSTSAAEGIATPQPVASAAGPTSADGSATTLT